MAGAAWAEGSSDRPAISERIAIQEARLPQIEAAATREREQIEQRAEGRRFEIARQTARRGAAQLSLLERALWTEFAQLSHGETQAEGYLYDLHFGDAYYDQTIPLRQALIEDYFVSEMAQLLQSDAFRNKLVQITEERLNVPLQPLLRERARKLLSLTDSLRAELSMGVRQLENARTGRLDAAMEWETTLKKQVRENLEYLRRTESKEPGLGVVESIGYSPQSGYFCMVEGVDRVLGTGDTIGAVRVLNIEREKVEFAKDGATWAQQLGAPAQSYWQ